MDFLIEASLIVLVVLGLIAANVLRMLLSQRIPEQVQMQRMALRDAPDNVADLFDRVDQELTKLGFEDPFWCVAQYFPDASVVPSLLRFYRHPSEPAGARVEAPFNVFSADRCSVTFFSRQPKGRILATANRIPELFPRPPYLMEASQITDVDDLDAQWRAHQEAMAVAGGEWGAWQDKNESLRILDRLERDSIAWVKRQGHVLPHPEGGLSPNWKVAFVFLWGLLTGKQLQPQPEHQPVRRDLAAVLFRNWRKTHYWGPPLSTQLTLFAMSTALFVVVGAAFWDWLTALLLVFTVMFHELGHYLAMRWFGYRNLQILMLPMVGGVAMGHEPRPVASNRALVSLMGPLPGIVLGWVLLILFFQSEAAPWAATLGIVLLMVNYLNLLPIMPLDGGQLIKSMMPPRWAVLVALFELLAVPALLLLGWMLDSLLLALLAVVPLLSALQILRRRKMVEALQTAWQEQGAAAELDRIACAIEVFDQSSSTYQALAKKAKDVELLIQDAAIKPASRLAAAFLLAVYVAAFALPLMAVPSLGPVVSALFSTPEYPQIDSAPFQAEAAAMDWTALVLAVEREAGAEFRAATGRPAQSIARPPATEAAITATEERTGTRLPPSYREFLGVSNGLGDIWSSSGEAWLLPVDAVAPADARGSDHLAALREVERSIAEHLPEPGLFLDGTLSGGEEFTRILIAQLEKSLVIGLLGGGEGFVALDPRARNAEGELPVLTVSLDYQATRYPSFRDYLESEYVQAKVGAAYRSAVQGQ